MDSELSSTKKSITWMMLLCLAFAATLVTRAAFVQLVPHARLEQMARRQFQSKVLIRPRRGLVTDRNGEPLAANTELASLAANPGKIQNRKTLARLLSKATDLPYSKLLMKLEEKKEFVWIKRHLREEEINRLHRWAIVDSEGDLPSGLWLVKESRRVYPHGELAAHSLGDVNVDSEGLEGVEFWMNERLSGKVVSVSAIKDALGRPAFLDSVAARHMQESRDGEQVALTLDASLQFAVEEELRSALRKHNAKAGNVIVMNAVNGEILALANQPAFNPNEKGTPADRKRNRALTDGYEPGSTMKPILLAGALSHGSKLTDQVYGENGKFILQGKKIGEAEAHEMFKWMSLKKMIQVSSNIGAAKLALKLGADRYSGTLKNFGFGTRTGTGFPGEIRGRVPPRKSWTPLALANFGFGQGLLATPMQVTRAYAAFLNGGWLVQPSLIKSVPGAVQEPPRRILTQKVAEQVLETLEAASQEGGTGVKAALPGYRVAGKTGTAQKVDPGSGNYSHSKYVSSFVGFALDVEPRIVIFVSLDEPRSSYYATDTAAPLFREVLNAVASRFGLPAKGTPIPRTLAGGSDAVRTHQASPAFAASASAEAAKDELHWQGAGANGRFLWKMPKLHGLTPREAIQALQGHHFQLESQGAGLIASQSPEAGKVIADGDMIRITLAEP